MAGLTAVDDIRAVFPDDVGAVFADIDLANFRCPGFHAVLQVGELGGSEVHHVVGEVGIHQFLFFVNGLDEFSELRTQLGALVFQVVVCFFKLVVVLKGLFLAVRHFRGGAFLLVLVEIPALALLCGGAGFGLDVIG